MYEIPFFTQNDAKVQFSSQRAKGMVLLSLSLKARINLMRINYTAKRSLLYALRFLYFILS
ncbi:hypothetical protein ASE74_07345 [Pedobacter sp. Leaf216]|nr:hypothetical protein ASE74_07345 [Pedobacter sp. Leaf216]